MTQFPGALPLNVYLGVYEFMLRFGFWYGISLILAIVVYFHALLSGIEPPMVWAFITFAVPVVGAIIYSVYFICFWKGLCVSAEEKEHAKEVIEKWRDTDLSDTKKRTLDAVAERFGEAPEPSEDGYTMFEPGRSDDYAAPYREKWAARALKNLLSTPQMLFRERGFRRMDRKIQTPNSG